MANKFNITQQCSEWSALIAMANMLVENPMELAKVFNDDDILYFGMALFKLECQLPVMEVPNPVSAILTEKQVEIFARLVDWFDEFLLSKMELLDRIEPVQFAAKYAQVGLVKRNLKQYATVYATSTDGEGTQK